MTQPHSPAHDALSACLDDLLAAANPYSLVLLRETALDSSCIDAGDIDLLGTEACVVALLQHVAELVGQGRCHARVVRPHSDKVLLRLYSTDARHSIVFDLWTRLWQIAGGTRCLHLEDVAERHPQPTPSAIQRFAPALEASLYLHHLASKNKDLRSPAVRDRLRFYATACEGADEPRLAAAIAATRNDATLSPTTLAQAQDIIRTATSGRPWSAHPSRVASRAWRNLRARVLLGGPHSRVVAVIGSDGAGKTALTDRIGSRPRLFALRVGKSLYRNSLLFRALYRANRVALRWTRERIDETLPLLPFGLALVRLRTLIVWRKLRGDRRTLLMDRFLPDFLYVARKTDRPRFAPLTGWLRCFGARAVVVHLRVPFDTLHARKPEVTRAGHAAYDADMMQTYCTADRADYVMFYNGGDVDDATAALSSLLTGDQPQPAAETNTANQLPTLLCGAEEGADVLDLTAGAGIASAFRSGQAGVAPEDLDTNGVLPFADASFDLVAVDETSAELLCRTRGEAESFLLGEARRVLRPNGQVLVETRNPWRRNGSPGHPRGPRVHMRALRRLGFSQLRLFGAQPKSGDLTVAAALDTSAGRERLYSRSGSTPAVSAGLRALGASPLATRVLARYFVVAGTGSPTRSSLEQAVTALVGDDAVIQWVAWSNPDQAIARLTAGDRDVIARVALDERGVERVERNAAALEALATSELAGQVPGLIARAEVSGRPMTVEGLLTGSPVDTLGGRGRPAGLTGEISDFLQRLQRTTTAATAASEWMERWLDGAESVLAEAAGSERVARFREYCLGSPELERCELGRAHGDFSPRNVLLDPATGSMTGVIDWDLSDECAPTFVDPLHWALRSQVGDVTGYYRVLREQIDALARGAVHPSDNAWWERSLWAHLVYGVWYNLNIARWLPAPRVAVAAGLLDRVPE